MKNAILKRIRNKAWVAAVVAWVVIGQHNGLYTLPENFEQMANVGLYVLTGLGVLIDPTTPGISDGM